MKFYRYVLRRYASMHDDDYYGSYHFSDIRLKLEEYDLVKETPKGYWIGSYINHRSEPFWKKWIPKESKKRFAYPTKKEALENYIKRTESRIKILESQIFDCHSSLSHARELKKKQNNES